MFGRPLESSALSSTLKLTSPPIRLRSDGKYNKNKLITFFNNFFKNFQDFHRRSGLEDGRIYRHSFGQTSKRSRFLVDGGTNTTGHGDDEDSLRNMLLEYVIFFCFY